MCGMVKIEELKYSVKVSPLALPRNWVVLEEFEYAGIKVPIGFKFDGCSIPIGLRWRFKHGGAKFPASALHDYLYRTGIVSKERADLLFYRLMIANGVSKHDAKIMYMGVKYGGKPSWNKRRREQNEAICD